MYTALVASRSDTGITKLRIVGLISSPPGQDGHVGDRLVIDGEEATRRSVTDASRILIHPPPATSEMRPLSPEGPPVNQRRGLARLKIVTSDNCARPDVRRAAAAGIRSPAAWWDTVVDTPFTRAPPATSAATRSALLGPPA